VDGGKKVGGVSELKMEVYINFRTLCFIWEGIAIGVFSDKGKERKRGGEGERGKGL